MLLRCVGFLLFTLTHVWSQTDVRPPWTMVTMTSNRPFIGRIAPVISHVTDASNSNGTIWLHSGASANDVWSSIDLGATWELRSGHAASLYSSVFRNASYAPLRSSSGCFDPNTNLNLRIGGVASNPDRYTNQVWTSINHTHWYNQSAPGLPPQKFLLSCVFTSNGDVIALGTDPVSVPNNTHVWRGRGVGNENEWQLVAITPWPQKLFVRDLVIAQMPIGEVLYVIGGVNVNNTVTNDVWASIDHGVSWVPFILDGGRNPHPTTVPTVRSFSPRTWHSVKVTARGVILLFGGIYNSSTLTDLYVSFDGGYNFFECAVEASSPPFFIASQGSVLTPEGELILVGGEYYEAGSPGIIFNTRVTKTSFSLNNSTYLAEMCGTQLPAEGVGLRRWPTTLNTSISASSDNGVQWCYLHVVVLVVLVQNLLTDL